MMASLRREYGQLVTSGAQLILLAVAIKLHSRTAWLVCLGLMALVSLLAWMSALRRARAIRDTPTSRIASAAQGYVELIGQGRPLPESPLLSRLTALPCLWYRYRIERKSGNKWTTEETGESDQPFLLDDGSGQCVVDPSGAEIITSHRDTWHREGYRYTEWTLLPQEHIYAIGQFRTFGGSSVEANINEEIRNVLTQWKQNLPDLHRRFDLNQDGQIDMQEWMLARKAARREAEKRIAAERAKPDINYMLQPQDGRLFLVSNLPQDRLAGRYALWVWAHLVIFFGALGGLAWLLSKPLLR